MSHKMKMYVYNNSGHTINSYAVTHSWNKKTKTLKGTNLEYKDTSSSVECTTGYGPEKDWYTIILDIDSIGHKSTDYYCNSSQKHNCVEISVHKDHVNCHYYTEGSPQGHSPDTSCKNKSYR